MTDKLSEEEITKLAMRMRQTYWGLPVSPWDLVSEHYQENWKKVARLAAKEFGYEG